MKKYKLGMYLGRFQPFHNGHKSIVDKMLEECEEVVIVVGSSDKKGTVRNPFPSWERADMIADVYKGQPVNIILMPDRNTIANDSAWGDYVMSYLDGYGMRPDAIYQGFEVERNTWYANYPEIEIVNLSRLDVPISATLVRAAIVEGREDYIEANCPPEVAKHIHQSIFWGRDFHDELV
jgi:cytidyltransferase-like protein